jgi:hypothetical protein
MSGTLGAWEDGNHGDGTPIERREDLPKVILDIDRDVDNIGDNQHREDIGNVRHVRDAVVSRELARIWSLGQKYGCQNSPWTWKSNIRRECLKWINQPGLPFFFTSDLWEDYSPI